MRPRSRRGLSMVIAVACFGLTAGLPHPARARGDPDEAPAVPAVASKTSHGDTPRLVRIGPQALIEVHEDGRVSMVDEAPPQRSRAAALAIFVGATFSIALVPPALTGPTNPSRLR